MMRRNDQTGSGASARALVGRMVCGALLVGVLAVGALANNPPKKSIKINFNGANKIKESCGIEATPTASGLSAADKAAVIAKVQSKYDNALGAGKVNVTEGTGGDVEIIVNGGTAPGTQAGKEYGDAGVDGKPGIVHEGEFAGAGFAAGAERVNGIGETAAHEAGHKLGLAHNWDNPPGVMTEGGKVNTATRKADNRALNADDTKKLQNLPKAVNARAGAKEGWLGPNDLGITVGDLIAASPNRPDDRHLDCSARYLSGPSGVQFGYISGSGHFVYQGDYLNGPSNPTYMSFLYTAGADMAVNNGGDISTLSNHRGTFTLSNGNPYNSQVYLSAQLQFMTTSGPATIVLDVVMPTPASGGFGSLATIPTVSEWGLIVLGLGVLTAGTIFIRRGRAMVPVAA